MEMRKVSFHQVLLVNEELVMPTAAHPCNQHVPNASFKQFIFLINSTLYAPGYVHMLLIIIKVRWLASTFPNQAIVNNN